MDVHVHGGNDKNVGGLKGSSNITASMADTHSWVRSLSVLATPIQNTTLRPSSNFASQAVLTANTPQAVVPPGKGAHHGNAAATQPSERPVTEYPKPSCSYTCLIGMALLASSNGSLPVSGIYKYIE